MKTNTVIPPLPETVDTHGLNHLFFLADWKHNGAPVTAIHGRDISTEDRYAEAPVGSLLISVIHPNGGSSQVMVPPNASFTR
jgi:hypothetical protein